MFTPPNLVIFSTYTLSLVSNFTTVARRPGVIIEFSNDPTVRLYATDLQDRIDVVVMTVDGNAVECGLVQIDDDVTFTDKEDIKMIVKALVKENAIKRNDIVYYGEYDGWLIYYFRRENVVFAASDDSVYPLGGIEDAVGAVAEVDERLRDIVAAFVSQLPL